MGPAELIHRIKEAAAKQTARRDSQGWKGINPVGPLVDLPEFNWDYPPEVEAILAGEAEKNS